MKKTLMLSLAFKKAAVCLLCAAAFPLSALAGHETTGNVATLTQQQGKVTAKGTVTDADKEPIVGATVREKGTNNATITDIDGNFTFEVSPGATLEISYLGYQSAEAKVEKNAVKVVMHENSTLMDELVVIGYGTQRKGDVTSAVASIKAEDFTQGKIGDAAELIKGKIAGLSIINSDGNPTATSSIRLRGVTSINGNNTPLILVDGIEGSLTTVAAENIASIDVLKDASAAAIYGTRGANGVILITTKTGQRSDAVHAEATYSDYFSFSQWTKKADFMTAEDVIYGRTSMTYRGYDTDWLKAISRKAGFTHNHDFQFSGGSRNATYSANLSYNKEEGMIINTDNENLKLQVDYTQYLMQDILKVNVNILTTRQKYSAANGNAAYAYRQAIIHNPTEPVYNADGSYYEDFSMYQYYNPVEILNEVVGNTTNRFTQMTGNISVEPIKGWETKLMVSWGESKGLSETFTYPDYYTLAEQTDYNGYASKGESTSIYKNLELTSRYSAIWNKKHRFEALVGYSYNYNVYESFSAGNGNFSTLAYLYNNLGNGSFITEEDRHASIGSARSDDTLIGFFGRVSYGYDNRYNILLSLRHEGSSKFGDNNKWATFPSVSLGWNITNEKFMKSTRDWLSNLRLRIGYGVTGITPNSSYLSQYLYTYNDYGDILDKSGNWIKTLLVEQNYNPDLKWETTKEWNFGLDYGFLNDRIHGTLDFYIKTTDDLLYEYAVPVPPNIYGYTMFNVGSMRNIGVEFSVTAIPVQTKDFSWETTVTLSHNKNKLLKLSSDLYETDNFQEVGGVGDPISVASHCMEVGHALGEFWGLKVAGYNKDGFALVEVRDDDGNWVLKPFNANLNSESNRQRLGSGTPAVFLGWCNTLHYKNFDLSLQFTGQFGFKILNTLRTFYENNSIAYNRLKSAADPLPAIDTNRNPVLDENGNQVYVTRSISMGQGFLSDQLENGDFLKLQNVTLNYTVPLKGNITKYIKGLRVYGSATNLFCITGYSGLDPEVSNYFLSPGIDDRDKYPTTRSYTVGLSIQF